MKVVDLAIGGTILSYLLSAKNQLFAAEKQDIIHSDETTIDELASKISSDLIKKLGKDTKWYAKSSSIDSKLKVILFPDQHIISGKDIDNQFCSVFDILKKYTNTFCLEGVEDKANDPIRSIYEMNQPFLPINSTIQDILENIKESHKAFYHIIESGINISGLENKYLYFTHLCTQHILSNISYVINSGYKSEAVKEASKNINILSKLIPLKKFIVKDFENNIQGNAKSPAFNQNSINTPNNLSKYYSEVETFFDEIADYRSRYAVHFLSMKKTGTGGVFYGAIHMDMIREGLKHENIGHVYVGNKDLDSSIESIKKTKEILSDFK